MAPSAKQLAFLVSAAVLVLLFSSAQIEARATGDSFFNAFPQEFNSADDQTGRNNGYYSNNGYNANYYNNRNKYASGQGYNGYEEPKTTTAEYQNSNDNGYSSSSSKSYDSYGYGSNNNNYNSNRNSNGYDQVFNENSHDNGKNGFTLDGKPSYVAQNENPAGEYYGQVKEGYGSNNNQKYEFDTNMEEKFKRQGYIP
ncbi:uncharacterized protein LOC131148223 [Malania oleifera]|uniref:uncharacterized protein LOC131148223 n=1 Tax=Malania oleifera TaxID=397392 RepID=UPI0025ADB538|nr:uncharacterized protein LOC131148223 [Malania oleifera]